MFERFKLNQKNQSQVGLDIGVNSCKLVELKPKGDSYELIRWSVEPIQHGDKKAAVKKLADRLSLSSATVYTAIAGKGTLIRYIEMARMPLDDLRKSFSYEADKYFPFPVDQIYTDCYILDAKAPGNKMSVLVAAAKKNLVDERMQLLTELGFHANFIGLNSIAVANFFNSVPGAFSGKADKAEDSAQGPIAIAVLDIGEDVSNVSIILNKLPRFTRDIFIGGREFTKNISNALGVSFEEAETLKCDPREKISDIRPIIESMSLNLISELRLSFDYFVTEKNVPISQLLLTGGGARLEGLSETFTKYLEIPVKLWNPLETLEINPELPKQELEKQAEKLGVALGLALYN